MADIRKPIFILVILLAVCAVAFIFSPSASPPSFMVSDTGTQVPPEPSAEVLEMLKTSKGFQHLIPYTARGFTPARLVLEKGETVRFINNSDEDLWIAATGASGAVYPGTGSECGQSSLDTCKILKKGDFWEITLSFSGVWGYQNNDNKEKTGILEVR